MSNKISASGLSDVGLVRENNEDVWAELPEEKFYVLADGMGGHQAGEIASQEAVFSFLELIRKILLLSSRKLNLKEMKQTIKRSIEEVNRTVYEMGKSDDQMIGMGTTFCCIHFHKEGMIYAHVGDSRIYRYRGSLLQLTKDHSLMRELIDMGYLSETEAQEFLYKNILTRAIGTEPKVSPSVESCEAKGGDLFMMCTDGLSDLLSNEEIESIIRENIHELDHCARILISEAKRKGGYDNITVVLLKVQENNVHAENISR